MQTEADLIIDALDGSTAVSRLLDLPISTVHSWRKSGIPKSRMSHLKLAVEKHRPDVDLDRLVTDHALENTAPIADPSCGKVEAVSTRSAAA